MKILILNYDLPFFPGRAGHEYLHTTYLAKLAQKVGLVSLVHNKEQIDKSKNLESDGVHLFLWKNSAIYNDSQSKYKPSLIRQYVKKLYDFFRTFPYRPQDTAIQDFQFRNISKALLEALSCEKWNIFIVIQSSSARALDLVPCFPVSVLVLHDVRSLVYERKALVAGNYKEKLLSTIEKIIYRHFERRYCQKYDLVITVSPTDEAWVREHYNPTRLVTVPIPVDSVYFNPMPFINEIKNKIIFTGLMNHPPNVDAAIFFAREVFPIILESIPDAEFWIVGKDPSNEVIKLSNIEGVFITGGVPDIRPCIAQSSVVVVPLRYGSGMRNKILEAWSMQKCVISTSIGAEGLDYTDGVNILIGDDKKSIALQVIRAIKEPELRDSIGKKGRELVEKQHNPKTLSRRYYEAITAVIEEKRKNCSPLRVVIDLRWMIPGVAGGVENQARSFIQQLLNLDYHNHYTLLIPSQIKYDFDFRGHDNFKIILADGPGTYWHKTLWKGIGLLHRCLGIDYWRSPEVEELRFVRSLNAEIAYSSTGYIYPDLFALKQVLVVPDIQHEYYAEFFTPEALAERRRVYTDSIRRADHVCTVSEFTRRTLIEKLKIPPDRVTTIHLAPDPIFSPQNRIKNKGKIILRKYDLKAGDYLFFPGNTWPHKNHKTVLKALKILKDEYNQKPMLVCTGSAKEAHNMLIELIKEWGLENQVKFLGYCPIEDMPYLYENAAALVFPSLFEGFGFPVVEAMLCECPVICSNATSLPEIAGKAAVLVDPSNSEHWAESINKVLVDNDLRQELVVNGLKEVQKFSWLKFAIQTVQVFQKVKEMT